MYKTRKIHPWEPVLSISIGAGLLVFLVLRAVVAQQFDLDQVGRLVGGVGFFWLGLMLQLKRQNPHHQQSAIQEKGPVLLIAVFFLLSIIGTLQNLKDETQQPETSNTQHQS